MVALFNPSQNVKYTPAELAQFAANSGFSGNQIPTIVGIAMAESGGNSQAQGDFGVGNYGSLGVLQVNSKAHGDTVALASLDPQTAFDNGYRISKGGTDFSPWSTYNNGAYQNFYDPSYANVAPTGGSTGIDPAGDFTNNFGTDPSLSGNVDAAGNPITNPANAGTTTAGDNSGGVTVDPNSGFTISNQTGGVIVPGVTGSGGLTYAPNSLETQQAPAGQITGLAIPDIANAIKTGVGSVTAQISTAVNSTLHSVEDYVTNVGFRLGVIAFACFLLLAAAWLLVPRETKETIVSTAAKAA